MNSPERRQRTIACRRHALITLLVIHSSSFLLLLKSTIQESCVPNLSRLRGWRYRTKSHKLVLNQALLVNKADRREVSEYGAADAGESANHGHGRQAKWLRRGALNYDSGRRQKCRVPELYMPPPQTGEATPTPSANGERFSLLCAAQKSPLVRRSGLKAATTTPAALHFGLRHPAAPIRQADIG